METKQDIRRQLLREREEQPDVRLRERAEKIAERLESMEAFLQASDVYLFASFGKEVDTWGIMADCIRKGKRVWLPKISGKEMDFFLYREKEGLIRNRFGMLEPEGTEEKADGQSGLIVVPALAADGHGYRIGYGGGYYDRYLARCRNLYKVVVLYGFQLRETLPHDTYDIPLDCVITEEGIFRCS